MRSPKFAEMTSPEEHGSDSDKSTDKHPPLVRPRVNFNPQLPEGGFRSPPPRFLSHKFFQYGFKREILSGISIQMMDTCGGEKLHINISSLH